MSSAVYQTTTAPAFQTLTAYQRFQAQCRYWERKLGELGITQGSVLLHAIPENGETLQTPMSEAQGTTLIEALASGKFRLATEEEKQQFQADMLKRERDCATWERQARERDGKAQLDPQAIAAILVATREVMETGHEPAPVKRGRQSRMTENTLTDTEQ